MTFVDPTLGTTEVRQHRRVYGSSRSAIHDRDRAPVTLAGATVTPEAAVIDNYGFWSVEAESTTSTQAWGPSAQRDRIRPTNGLGRGFSGKPVSRPSTKAVNC